MLCKLHGRDGSRSDRADAMNGCSGPGVNEYGLASRTFPDDSESAITANWFSEGRGPAPLRA
jgi:hypothetical protein